MALPVAGAGLGRPWVCSRSTPPPEGEWAPGRPSPHNSPPAALPPVLLYDAIVVDEAAQALEPATLIPLCLLKPGGKARARAWKSLLLSVRSGPECVTNDDAFTSVRAYRAGRGDEGPFYKWQQAEIELPIC
jgi:hypothetical protein